MIKIIIGKLLCRIGIHNYFHYYENNRLVGLPGGDTYYKVPVRECKVCGYREHHLMPKQNGNCYNWKPYMIEKGTQTLHFREV